mmetsp:Transcript_10885/g.15563  ORF Transcript_10885/g.15563 Transcript_10885/m.15563 type:complete len:166 (-) Transcript_10885:314-811(-)
MDRLVLNPLETRCPTIRNTLGWAVEMHRSGSNNNNSNSNKPILTAGLAYQLNRSVAIKVIGGSSSSSSHGLTGVVTLKRWQHPRMTASILVGNSNNNHGLHFRGLAFELELGGSSNQQHQNKDRMDSYYYHGDEDAGQNNSSSGSSESGPPPPPPTKVILTERAL